MTSRSLTSRYALAALLSVWLVGAPLGASPAHAQGAQASAATQDRAEDDAPEWQALTAEQKRVLRPLAQQWGGMDDTSRDKWLNVADQFKRLSPAEQQRVQTRMVQWSRLPPQERGEARLRFQQSRQLPAAERQRKWEAYQALPPEERQDITRQAQRKAKPVYLPDNMSGPREARQAYSASKDAAHPAASRKSNVVPRALNPNAPAPMVVAPAVVKAGPGATTNLVTQRPTPPGHQHSGMPKITASKHFVDPVTLLPKKGAQGAAITPPNQSNEASAPTQP